MTLDGSVLGLVLLAAVLHASWNALTKASRDPLLNMTVVSASGGLAAAAAIPFLPLPAAAAWPYLGVSIVLHFAYHLSLVRSYGLGDLSQVYPIARGLAPLGVAALAAALAEEVPAPRQVAGLLLASGAITSLGWIGRSQRSSTAAVTSALATAAFISGYTVVDGQGVRSAGNPLSYIAWLMFLDTFPILAFALARRRARLGAFLRAEGPRAACGGLMALLGYGIVLWATTRASMAPVAALRETSVVFAALLGARLLREPFGTRRLLASAALALGLALVQV